MTVETFFANFGHLTDAPNGVKKLRELILQLAVQGITEAQLSAPGKVRPYTEARGLAAAIVQESANIALTELGRRLGRDIASLGRAAQRYLALTGSNRQMNRKLDEVRVKIADMTERQT